MKKFTIALLTAVYLLSVTGVSAGSFYCGGFLNSTTFSFGEVKGANSNAAAKTDGCCKTIKHSFKVKDNHYAPGFSSVLIHFVPVISPFCSFKCFDGPQKGAYIAFDVHAPPLWGHPSIYTLYCSYLI